MWQTSKPTREKGGVKRLDAGLTPIATDPRESPLHTGFPTPLPVCLLPHPPGKLLHLPRQLKRAWQPLEKNQARSLQARSLPGSPGTGNAQGLAHSVQDTTGGGRGEVNGCRTGPGPVLKGHPKFDGNPLLLLSLQPPLLLRVTTKARVTSRAPLSRGRRQQPSPEPQRTSAEPIEQATGQMEPRERDRAALGGKTGLESGGRVGSVAENPPAFKRCS